MKWGLLWVLIVFLVLPALAQDTATLTGRVQDPTGAVVVGAAVSVVNTATNIESSTVTNEEGLYRLVSLRPGNYRLTVNAQGFKKFVREGLDLRVGTTVSINANLDVGSTTDTVEVTGAAPLLETETSTTGTNIEGDYFYRMPLYQRNIKGIMYLTPGVQVSGFGYSGNLSGFNINGESSNRLSFYEDGMYGVSPNNNGWTTDTIQNTVDEVKILTTALPAEYGHSAGGSITVVKKSGTNELHGLISEYGRWGALQHRRFFQIYQWGQEQPVYKSNGTLDYVKKGDRLLFQMPDGNISGPIYIPKIYDGRNKSFFLFAFQRLIEKQGIQNTYTVPTAAMKQGDFSFAERPTGVLIDQIYDPRTTVKNSDGTWSRSPYAGNIIPQAQWDNVAKKIMALDIYTSPNTLGSYGTEGPSANLLDSYQKKVFWENYSTRLDHQLTQKLKTWANWTYNSRFERSTQPKIKNSDFDSSLNKSMNYQNTAGIGGTYVISPTLISESRMSYYRYENRVSSVSYGRDWSSVIGLPGLTDPKSMPQISQYLPYVGNPSNNVQENFNFKEDISKMSGKHAFKFGYDLMRMRSNSYTVTNAAGNYTLTDTNGLQANGSAMANTGISGLPQLLSGAVSSASFTINLLSTLPRDWIHSLYFQDDWKVRPNLTLNLGLRWQVESVMNNKYGQQSNFDPNAADNVAIGKTGVITHPKDPLYKKDWNNFQPRFGMAWTVKPNIVVRGGFAVNTVDFKLQSPPTNEYGSISGTISQASGDYRPAFLLQNGATGNIVWPSIRADGTIPYANTSNYSSRSASWVDPNRHNPYTMNWNFSVQYGLSSNYLVSVEYTGNRGVNNTESWSINNVTYDWAWNLYTTNLTGFNAFVANTQNYRPFTNFGSISYMTNGANSNFHSGTAKIEKRYSYGLSFLAYYTFSKGIDSSTGDWNLNRLLDRSRSSYDRTHEFVSSMNYEIPIGKGRKWMNRGGILNTLIGGFDMVWMYTISSGNPATWSFGGSSYSYMPSVVSVRSNSRPNSTAVTASLREGWADIGTDRWTRANQNKLIDGAQTDYFSYPAAYTLGNVGRYTMDTQRFISANFSMQKEVKFKERFTFQFRYDFQNPFKWYNLPSVSTTFNTRDATNFASINPSSSSEASTANGGGVPLQNFTLAIRF
jgi:hypothetical protein